MSLEPVVVRADQVVANEARYPAPFDDEALALGRDLATAAGAERLGCWLDTIAPGRRTSRLHAHTHEEEALYVLSGHPTLEWCAPGAPIQTTPLRPGDYVAFPAGTGLAHSLRNRSEADAVVLVVGERRAEDRLVYPHQPEFEAWRTANFPERTWPDAEAPDGSATPPAYRIETPRLVLRPLQPTDVWPLVRKVRENLDRLKPWFIWAQQVPSIDAQLAWIRGRNAAFANDEDYGLGAFARNGALIGCGGLHLRQGPGAVELGYWIDAAYEGQGLVTEWVAGVTRLSIEVLGFERCIIRCDVGNVRSSVIPRRLGYTLTSTDRGVCVEGDIERNIQTWVLRHTDYPGSPSEDAPVRAWDGAHRRLL